MVLEGAVTPLVQEVGPSLVPQRGVVGPEGCRSPRHSHALRQRLLSEALGLGSRLFLGDPQTFDDLLHSRIPGVLVQVADVPEAVVPHDDHELLHQFREALGIVADLLEAGVVLVHVGQSAVIVGLRQFVLPVLQVEIGEGQEALHPRAPIAGVLRQGVPQVIHALLSVQLLEFDLGQGIVNLVPIVLVLVLLQHVEEQLLDLHAVPPPTVKGQGLLHAGLELHFVRGFQFDHLFEEVDGLAVAAILPLQLGQHEEGPRPLPLGLDLGDGAFDGAHGLLDVVLGQEEFSLNEKRVRPQLIRRVPLAHRLEQRRIGLRHVLHGHVGPGKPSSRRHLAVRFLVLPLQVFEHLLRLGEVSLVEMAFANQRVVVVNPPIQLRALEVLLNAPWRRHGMSIHHPGTLLDGPFHQRVQEVRLVLGAIDEQGNHLIPVFLVGLGELLVCLLHRKAGKVEPVEPRRRVVIGPIEPAVTLRRAPHGPQQEGQRQQTPQKGPSSLGAPGRGRCEGHVRLGVPSDQLGSRENIAIRPPRRQNHGASFRCRPSLGNQPERGCPRSPHPNPRRPNGSSSSFRRRAPSRSTGPCASNPTNFGSSPRCPS